MIIQNVFPFIPSSPVQMPTEMLGEYTLEWTHTLKRWVIWWKATKHIIWTDVSSCYFEVELFYFFCASRLFACGFVVLNPI